MVPEALAYTETKNKKKKIKIHHISNTPRLADDLYIQTAIPTKLESRI